MTAENPDIPPEMQLFSERARVYCDLIAQRKLVPLREFLCQVEKALLDLYLGALDLKWHGATGEGDPMLEMTNDQKSIVFGELADLFVPISENIVDSPFAAELWNRYFLADDLADINRDMSDGLAHFDRGGAAELEDAIWTWGWGFDNHWGYHLTRALRTLQWMLHGEFFFE